MVDVEVVTPDASGEDVDLLPVGGLLSRGRARSRSVSSFLPPGCLITNGEYHTSSMRLCDVVMRIGAPQDSGDSEEACEPQK